MSLNTDVGVMGKTRKIKVRNKRYEIRQVENISESVPDLIALNYSRPFKDTIGLLHPKKDLILITEKLTEREKESTILHEIIHACLPNLTEKNVKNLEIRIFPTLYNNGLRFLSTRKKRGQ